MMLADTSIEYGVLIKDRDHLRQVLSESGKQHYTYVLRRPNGDPFYVGIGQGLRMFSHVDEAKDSGHSGLKVETIREIWSEGGEVQHTIDQWHDNEPWVREAELIEAIGQIKHGTGPLTNAQDYSPSHVVNGVEVRKYRDVQRDDVNEIPDSFKLKTVRLMTGPREPRTRRSVFGKIYTALEENPGVTGSELVSILLRVDFSSNKSAYTQSGAVCAAWVCGYIEGGYFRSDTQYIQRWKNE